MFKRLVLFLVVAAALLVGSSVANATNPANGPICTYGSAGSGNPAGYNWGEFDHLGQPGVGGSIQTNLDLLGYWTPADSSHILDRIGIQSTGSSSVPQVQAGIIESGGTAPQFFVEEQGAPNPGGWTYEGVPNYYYYAYGSPQLNTAYTFRISRTSTGYVISAPGYTSPNIPMTISAPDSTLSNEVEIPKTETCPESNVQFSNYTAGYWSSSSQFTQTTYNHLNDFYDLYIGSGVITIYFPYQDEGSTGCSPGVPCLPVGM